MDILYSLYAEFLHRGFIVLRFALDSRDEEWINAEYELLHNVPSLLNEEKNGRHEYFWTKERTHYIEWNSTQGPNEAKDYMQMFYEPLWEEMEPLILERIGEPPDPECDDV